MTHAPDITQPHAKLSGVIPAAKPICLSCARTQHEAEVLIRKGALFICGECLTDFGMVMAFGAQSVQERVSSVKSDDYEVLLRIRSLA